KIHCVAEGLQNWDFPVDLAKIASVFAMEAGHQQAEGPGLSPEFADDKGDDFTDEQNLEEIPLKKAFEDQPMPVARMRIRAAQSALSGINVLFDSGGVSLMS